MFVVTQIANKYKTPCRNVMKKKYGVIYTLVAIAIVILAWYIAARVINVEFLLPSPSVTLNKLIYLFGLPDFYGGIATTTLHAVLAFLLAFVFAAVLAIFASLNAVVERLLSPIVLIIRVAPTMSVIFLSILWISSKNSPYLVGIFVLFPIIYSRILSAIKSVDGELLEMAKVYRVKKRDIVFGLYLPYVGNSVLDECPGFLSFGVKLAVSGEAVAQSGINIGSLMSSSKANLETAELIAYTVTAILVGFCLEQLFKLVIFVVRRAIRNAKTHRN